jgi:hypothetical protein
LTRETIDDLKAELQQVRRERDALAAMDEELNKQRSVEPADVPTRLE